MRKKVNVCLPLIIDYHECAMMCNMPWWTVQSWVGLGQRRVTKIRRQTVPGHWTRDGETARLIAGQASPWNDEVTVNGRTHVCSQMSPTLGRTCRPRMTKPANPGSPGKRPLKWRQRVSHKTDKRFGNLRTPASFFLLQTVNMFTLYWVCAFLVIVK